MSWKEGVRQHVGEGRSHHVSVAVPQWNRRGVMLCEFHNSSKSAGVIVRFTMLYKGNIQFRDITALEQVTTGFNLCAFN